jgi:DNA sulfur modification protein DndE
MRLNRIRVSKDASDRLKQLKGRTGLTPNILCRIGFCLSLNESSIPNPTDYPEEDREFNRYTLLGEWDDLYVALLRQRLHQDGLDDEHLELQFRAHINRGVITLSKLTKGVADLVRLAQRNEHPKDVSNVS